MTPPADRTFTVEWLESAIDLIAFVIVTHGAVYGPLLDRLERELAELKRQDDPVSRAKRRLAQRAA